MGAVDVRWRDATDGQAITWVFEWDGAWDGGEGEAGRAIEVLAGWRVARSPRPRGYG
jgi:hypothetical protein